jgi:phage terminase small subunit
MPALKNIRHEKFCQGIVSGLLSQTKAYASAGYSERGAKQSAARLLNNADVRSRIAELRAENSAEFLQLAVTEREQRLLAIQERFDGLRQARLARAAGDYDAMMATGFVCRRLRTVGSGKDSKVVEEYEIDTGMVEAMNAIEKRAAIETGQESENVNLTGHISAKSIALSKIMTLPELEALEKKMLAEMEKEKAAGKVVEAPKP